MVAWTDWGKGPAVSRREVACQAVSDWFGKEVQNGYTVTYIWMTNQLGHFTLGFLFTFVVVWIAESIHATSVADCSPWSAPLQALLGAGTSGATGPSPCIIPPYRFLAGWVLAVPLGQILFWSLKERRDFKIAVKEAGGHAFPVDPGDISKDAITAVWFITVGIIVAYLSFVSWLWAVVAFVVATLISLWPAWYWLSRKLCFQRADLPYLYRLADFASLFGPSGQAPIEDLLSGRATARHLLVFGGMGTGRTSLAVGIGTEHTFVVRTARYLTWAKFMESAQQPDPKAERCGPKAWPWRQSDLVILDDIVKTIGDVAATDPQSVAHDLGRLPPAAVDALAARHTVWVLGPIGGDQTPVGWIETLGTALRLQPADFRVVELVMPPVGKPKVPVSSLSGH